MRLLLALFLILSTTLVCATPVTISGTHLTAVDDTPGYVGLESHQVNPPWVDTCLVLLDVLVTPTGGTYRYETNQTWFNTLAGVTLDLLNSTGKVLERLTLTGRDMGYEATTFRLQGSAFLTVVPAAFNLYFEGRDARLDWSVSLEPSQPDFSNLARSAVPEPMSLLMVGLGAGLVIQVHQGGRSKQN
jgi:hypothetical protein